jgi:peptide-methionine (S)-S-oxide reductase
MEKATFAAGCFWGVEAVFQKTKGVKDTKVGYTGGFTKNPTYKEVCTNKTGHAEAVQIKYESKEITYEKLLEIFWNIHDPTQLNRQGPDVGTQYRSAIFYHNEEQKKIAEKSRYTQQQKYDKKIVTEISPLQEFYLAEEYHQNYFKKNKSNSCRL